MKNKIKIILIFLITFFTVGCVKQRNCDCEKEGILIKYDNYSDKQSLIDPECPGGEQYTVAVFHNDVVSTPIIGKIPKKYLSEDSIKVSVCLKLAYKDGGWCLGPYKLTCIEEIN